MQLMNRYERAELQRLVRHREKVLKASVKQRSKELLAEFEHQMGQEYSFDSDPVWKKATALVQQELQKAKKVIDARCRELGIPKEFAPTLNLDWQHRGYGNLLEKRRAELRRMAKAEVEAIEAKAIVQIQTSCLDAQTELTVSGLTSDAAHDFLAKLPKIETLMPPLNFRQMKLLADQSEDE